MDQFQNCLLLAAASVFLLIMLMASAGAALFGFGLVGFGQESALLLFALALVGVVFGVRFAKRVVVPLARSALDGDDPD